MTSRRLLIIISLWIATIVTYCACQNKSTPSRKEHKSFSSFHPYTQTADSLFFYGTTQEAIQAYGQLIDDTLENKLADYIQLQLASLREEKPSYPVVENADSTLSILHQLILSEHYWVDKDTFLSFAYPDDSLATDSWQHRMDLARMRYYNNVAYHIDSSLKYIHKVEDVVSVEKLYPRSFTIYQELVRGYYQHFDHHHSLALAERLLDKSEYATPPSDSMMSIAHSVYAYTVFRFGHYDRAYASLDTAMQLADYDLESYTYQLALYRKGLIINREGKKEMPNLIDSLIESDIELHHNFYRVKADEFLYNINSLNNLELNTGIDYAENALDFYKKNTVYFALESNLIFILSTFYQKNKQWQKSNDVLYYELIGTRKFDFQKLIQYPESEQNNYFFTLTDIARNYLHWYRESGNKEFYINAEKLVNKCIQIFSDPLISIDEDKAIQLSGIKDDTYDLFIELLLLKFNASENIDIINTIINIHFQAKSEVYRIDKFYDIVSSNSSLTEYTKLKSTLKGKEISIYSNDVNNDLFDRINSIEEDLRKNYSSLIKEETLEKLDVNQLRKNISNGDCVIFYRALSEGNFFITTITKEGIQAEVIKLDNELSNLTLKIPDISRYTEFLIFPDGRLHQFNFRKSIKEVKEECEVYLGSSINSIHTFIDEDTSHVKKMAAFFFTDEASLKSSYNIKMSPLPGNIAERKQLIKNHGDKVDVFSGKNATVENFWEVYQDTSYSHIHIATHGIASGEVREDIKLYFRNNSYGVDSVYGYDLIQKHSTIKHITLTSCEGRKGKIVLNNNIYSLGNYFLFNGVSTVIVAFEKINDFNFQLSNLKFELQL